MRINYDSASCISKLHGIGLKLAERIVEHRKENGFFNCLEDLAKVKGISKAYAELLDSKIDWSAPQQISKIEFFKIVASLIIALLIISFVSYYVSRPYFDQISDIAYCSKVNTIDPIYDSSELALKKAVDIAFIIFNYSIGLFFLLLFIKMELIHHRVKVLSDVLSVFTQINFLIAASSLLAGRLFTFYWYQKYSELTWLQHITENHIYFSMLCNSILIFILIVLFISSVTPEKINNRNLNILFFVLLISLLFFNIIDAIFAWNIPILIRICSVAIFLVTLYLTYREIKSNNKSNNSILKKIIDIIKLNDNGRQKWNKRYLLCFIWILSYIANRIMESYVQPLIK